MAGTAVESAVSAPSQPRSTLWTQSQRGQRSLEPQMSRRNPRNLPATAQPAP
ncbi:hypothetical protein I545_1177 [Mycobacterium kansasii 662]|uniref:Uncharacterized protein n=2 Tax=Mycobacterium kansasii TaxID=1768 RepID=A0A1V3XWQ1_MYCKA|nr:hypothetical protein I547_0056 [Mycobacterium kansasii 824]EUA21700.1 hypothetical protein I545_1177 [Mycobacterium kansasii 662]OOK82067.1 hypothetical protein BZL30_0390 [Mycobacterium kansasii]OOK83186.1 hypothetical protein BZL29_1433 [Mycobacterium kansasii]